MQLTEEEYLHAEDSYQGYCPDCDDLTRDCTEPDAEGYDCPCCGGRRVVGAMTAMLVDWLEIDA